MKKILILFVIAFLSCTEQEVIDTGISNPLHDCSIMEYLRSDPYNWDLTAQMIERAGLTDLFEGKVDTASQITFWGPVSYTIQRFMFASEENGNLSKRYKKITDIPVDLCREMILKFVVNGKYLKNDIAYINKDFQVNEEEQDGCTDFITMGDSELRAYREKTPYGGVPDIGPEYLRLYSFTAKTRIPLATPNLQFTNGVVHSLNYSYNFPLF